jgi:hypothetical protein
MILEVQNLQELFFCFVLKPMLFSLSYNASSHAFHDILVYYLF